MQHNIVNMPRTASSEKQARAAAKAKQAAKEVPEPKSAEDVVREAPAPEDQNDELAILKARLDKGERIPTRQLMAAAEKVVQQENAAVEKEEHMKAYIKILTGAEVYCCALAFALPNVFDCLRSTNTSSIPSTGLSLVTRPAWTPTLLAASFWWIQSPARLQSGWQYRVVTSEFSPTTPNKFVWSSASIRALPSTRTTETQRESDFLLLQF